MGIVGGKEQQHYDTDDPSCSQRKQTTVSARGNSSINDNGHKHNTTGNNNSCRVSMKDSYTEQVPHHEGHERDRDTTVTTLPHTATSSSSSSLYVRRAIHQGSWYDDDPIKLDTALQRYLDQGGTIVPSSRWFPSVDYSCNNDNGTKEEDETKEQEQVQGKDVQQHLSLAVSPPSLSCLRGLIVPHAGYAYSGSTAAYSYAVLRDYLSCLLIQKQKQELPNSSSSASVATINHADTIQKNHPKMIQHIVILHPSHHYYMKGICAVSNASVIETPLGNLRTSETLRNEILQLGSVTKVAGTATNANYDKSKNSAFTLMTRSVDEKEHSNEMQYPFLYKILNDCNCVHMISITSIMCGSLSTDDESYYGKLLVPILMERPEIITIVSTDFCHWGKRFSYQPFLLEQPHYRSAINTAVNTATTKPTHANASNDTKQLQFCVPIQTASSAILPIHEQIKSMDCSGMDCICSLQPKQFASYLSQTHNTICGRHAVSVYLNAIDWYRITTSTTTTTTTTTTGSTTTSTSYTKTTNENQQEPVQDVSIQFLNYKQSSKVQSAQDSSVSYAGAAVYGTSASASAIASTCTTEVKK